MKLSASDDYQRHLQEIVLSKDVQEKLSSVKRSGFYYCNDRVADIDVKQFMG